RRSPSERTACPSRRSTDASAKAVSQRPGSSRSAASSAQCARLKSPCRAACTARSSAPMLRSGRRTMPSWWAVASRSWTTPSEPCLLFWTTHCNHCSSTCFRPRRTGAVSSTPVTCGDETPPAGGAAASAGVAGIAAAARKAAVTARRRALAGLLDIADPHPVQQILQERVLLGGEIAGRLLPQDVEQVDVQAGHLQVLRRLPVRQLDVAEIDGDRLGEHRHEVVERRTEPGRRPRHLQRRLPAVQVVRLVHLVHLGQEGGRIPRRGGARRSRRGLRAGGRFFVQEPVLFPQLAVGQEHPLVGDLDLLVLVTHPDRRSFPNSICPKPPISRSFSTSSPGFALPTAAPGTASRSSPTSVP